MRVLTLLLLALSVACAVDAPLPEADASQLLAADRAFAAETEQRGLDGWMAWFSEDALRVELHGPIVHGLAAIREHDRALHDDPQLSLLWEPTDAMLFSTADHGITRGRYRIVRDGPQGQALLSSGSYLTLWRREHGAWKAILDTGAPDPPAAANPTDDG